MNINIQWKWTISCIFNFNFNESLILFLSLCGTQIHFSSFFEEHSAFHIWRPHNLKKMLSEEDKLEQAFVWNVLYYSLFNARCERLNSLTKVLNKLYWISWHISSLDTKFLESSLGLLANLAGTVWYSVKKIVKFPIVLEGGPLHSTFLITAALSERAGMVSPSVRGLHLCYVWVKRAFFVTLDRPVLKE